MGKQSSNFLKKTDAGIDIETSRDRGWRGTKYPRRAVPKDGGKGGGKPPPWGSEVWKSSEVWKLRTSEKGGTEQGSTRSTGGSADFSMLIYFDSFDIF